jgi:AraC-like DNA-binding protein
MIVGRLLVWVFLSPINNQFFYIDNLTWFSALLWLTIYSVVLIKPDILYGYRYLQKMADNESETSIFSRNIWHLEQPNKAIISLKELILYEKISSLIPSYIHNLENISLNTDFFRNPECNFNDLAGELKIPINHLNYLLKYHCNESFINYRKIIRINDAVNLINLGFLKTNTVQSLAITVGFVAYSTFSSTFKEITGSTAQEYVRKRQDV